MPNNSINDLEIYREAMDFGGVIWSLVEKWDYFAKDTIGKQLVRCTDSIAANISEGHGRFHFKEINNSATTQEVASKKHRPSSKKPAEESSSRQNKADYTTKN